MKVVDLASTNDFGEQFLLSMCQELELDHATYGRMNRLSGDVAGYTTLSPEWCQIYEDKRYHMKDPAMVKAVQRVTPTDWSEFRGEEAFQTVARDAHDFGMGYHGIAIPLHGANGEIGVLNVCRNASDDEWHKLKNKILGELQLRTIQIHDAVTDLPELSQYITENPLSHRELEVLQWVAAGKTQQDVADILSLSTRTVETHLRIGKSKLGVISTPQAIGRAVGLGLILPG